MLSAESEADSTMDPAPESDLDRPLNHTVARTLLCVGLAVLALTLVASGGAAGAVGENATEISHCTEITESGEYVLTEDLAPSAPENLTLDTDEYPRSACIAVNETGVTIDGNGYEIDGTTAHANDSGQYYGIRVQNLSDAAGTDEESALNVWLTNMTLTQWSRGIYSYNTHALFVNDSRVRSDLSGQTSGVHLQHSDNATIRRNVVDGPSKGVVLSGESNDVNVTHNDITNTSISAIESDGDRLLLANNHIEDFGGSNDARGILLEDAPGARIVDNVVLDGYEAIASFGGPNADVTILNNTLSGEHTAISVDDLSGTLPGSSSAVLRNNSIDEFARGIEVQHRTAVPTIVDNDVSNATEVGIAIFGGSDHGLVESNVVTASDDGIWVYSDDTTVQDNDFSGNDRAVDLVRSEDSTIRRNDLSKSESVGLYAMGANGGTIVANNTITDSNGVGVEITANGNDVASGVVVEHNEIARNQDEGVLVSNDNLGADIGPRDLVIRANNVSANGREGIVDGDGYNATYVDNRIADNADLGIVTYGDSQNATILNNTIEANGGVGVEIGRGNGGGNNAIVEGNELAGNSDHAILIEESPGVVLTNNSMNEHDVDLRLSETSGVEVKDNTFETGIEFGVAADEHYLHEMSGNAFHDGSPLYYAAGDTTPSVPEDARQVIVVDADGLTLADLDLTTGEVSTGVLVATSNGSTIENVTVSGPARQGVRLVSVTNATVDGATVDGARGGIAVEASPGIDLRNATVTNVAGSETGKSDGIEVRDSAGAAIRDSYVHNASGIGIDVTQGADFLLESSAVEETGARGVIVRQSPGATVRTSSITDANYAGVLVTDASNSSVEEMVVLNHSASATSGIRVIDSHEVALLDNHVQGIGGEGITTTGSANVTIVDTYAYDNEVGIDVGTAGSVGEANAVLRRNEVVQNDLGVDGQQVAELINNTIRDSTNDGASVMNSEGTTMSENLFRDNGGDGVYLDGLSETTVANNRFRDNGKKGIYIDGIVDTTVASNVFHGNDVGLYDAGSTELLIDSNTLRHHDSEGIDLETTDEFTVRNNTIETTADGSFDNAVGVYVQFDAGEVGTVVDNTFESNDVGVRATTEDYTDDVIDGNLTVRDNDFVENTQGVQVNAEPDVLVITNNAFNATVNEAVVYTPSNPTVFVNATQNWWGAADGPSGGESDPVTGVIANGSGDAVGANVTFDPWLGDNSSVGSNLTADVSVVGASLNATDVELNGAVTVTADVQNVGNASGTYSADLEIDGSVEETTTVTVAAGVTDTITFTHAFPTAGDYDVSVDGVTAGTVSVEQSGNGNDDGSGGSDGGSDNDGDSGDDGSDPSPPTPSAPEPSISVENASAGVELTITDAHSGEAVSVPVDGAVETGGVDLTTLAITLAESGDFEATIAAHEGAPSDAGELPDTAQALGYLDVAHELDDGQIEGATFEFSVSIDELEARDLDATQIVLYHSVDGEWVERETTVVEEREDAVDLRADVPHFSWFAVAGTQPSFDVDASLATTELQAGEMATIEATVTNDGSAAGELEVTHSIDGESVNAETVTVDAGDQATVTFDYGFEESGEYVVAVNGATLGTVTVDAAESDDDDAGADSETDGASDGVSDDDSGDGSPGFGIGAAGLALICATLIAVRRRA